MKKFLFTLILVCCGIIGLGIGGAQPVLADGVPDYRLQISPVQNGIELLEPGQTYRGSFEVINTGNKPYSFETGLAPYSVQGRDYDPDITTITSRTEIMDWITLEYDEAEIAPSERSKIKYIINVPEDAPAGLQGAVIKVRIAESSEAEGAASVAIDRQIAFALYANIDGDTRTGGEVIENKIPMFIFNPPLVMTSVVKNTGNIYTQATYSTEIRNFFGDQVAYSTADKPETKVIFPDTERYNEVSWDGAPQLGIFKVKQTVKIFDSESVVEKIVILCPLWFLVLVIAMIGLIIYIVVFKIIKGGKES